MKDAAVLPQKLNTDASKIQMINSIGAIIDNSLLLHSPNRLLIEIESIQRAEVHKKRISFSIYFLLGVRFLYFMHYMKTVLPGLRCC
ncbi:MAG: hypothetical protein M0D53_01330 [Flavobacterium sp. JAD_PAG50586_2]|nr:MAG: hypothetical protein M0D53_01330 [Flavobacterium sp. JAD_PAG50586_2]